MSRRSVALGLAVVLLIVVLLAALLGERSCGGEPPGTTEPAVTTGPVTTTGQSGAPDAAVEATLLEVVDGDTIWVRMLDGTEEKVRYIGMDAPEIAHGESAGEYLGPEASTHNAELLASGPLRLATDVEPRDDFGRLLAYVWAGGVFINERMVADGYAWAHNYPPNLTRQQQLWDAHDAAKKAGIGVWGRSDQ